MRKNLSWQPWYTQVRFSLPKLRGENLQFKRRAHSDTPHTHTDTQTKTHPNNNNNSSTALEISFQRTSIRMGVCVCVFDYNTDLRQMLAYNGMKKSCIEFQMQGIEGSLYPEKKRL